MNDFKNSMNKIEASEEIKTSIYNNIMEMAEKPKITEFPKRRNQWQKTAIAAVLAVAVFGVFAVNNNMFKDNILQTQTIGETQRNVSESVTMELYFIENDTIAKQYIYDCPQEAMQAWELIMETELFDEDLELVSYNIDETVLTLNFNRALSELETQAIESSFLSLYEEVDTIIIE